MKKSRIIWAKWEHNEEMEEEEEDDNKEETEVGSLYEK